ncbi:hypothetical protein VTJ83DRAFT_7444 [Remersonia thermophila]|uniref:FAD-binding FR-type domain-containing protein n=1 Tax=Remersonia thermophila TaxID=72144 RepID=A0ABR4D4K8_9PEZI
MAGGTGSTPAGGVSSGHGNNASSGGGTHTKNEAYFAARQIAIERHMRYFAAGMCGLLAVFVVYHWVRRLSVKLERSKSLGAVTRPFVVSTRLARNVLVRKVPGFKSAGHALLVTAYVAINLALSFTDVDTTSMGSLGHRFGWISLGNMVIVIFLALKNTPLSFLTAHSYEQLNGLHQIAGCVMFILMVLHAALYTAYFNGQGRMESIYAEPDRIAGIVSGFAFLGAVFSAIFLRSYWYELFYVMHILFWVLGIITVGLHQPDFGHKILIVTILTGALWAADRLVRGARVLLYSVNNEVTLHPLPDGGTKVVLKKAPALTKPGKHCFIWIPAVRKFETHPFTVHRSEPVEFTIKARDGFTRDLHQYALTHPGATLKASVDGPYGTFPDPMEFDKIVLLAGGGGATFTFGLAMNVLERMNDRAPKNLVFIWAVKKHENLSWFREQLDMLRTHPQSPNVNVTLYVTRAPTTSSPAGESSSSSSSSNNNNNSSGSSSGSSTSSINDVDSPPLSPTADEKAGNPLGLQPTTSGGDIEKEALETHSGYETSTSYHNHGEVGHPVRTGRPDVAALIRDAVSSTPATQRVLVAACGPDPLMNLVRNTTAQLISGDGPGVELHLEQFGW